MGDVKVNKLQFDLTESIKKINQNAGNMMVKETRKNSPDRTGKYKSGWTFKQEENNDVVIYNEKQPTLTHLIELGHKTKNKGFVPPNEHIRPAYNVTKEIYLEELKKIKGREK